MTRPIKVGVMSFAHPHASGFVSALKGRAGVEVLTADPDYSGIPEDWKRGRAAADHLDVGYVNTYKELLGWRPDAVIVCSENTRHRADIEIAAAAGAHVLCEKPLATTVEDARAAIAACTVAEVFLMTAFPVRFSPEFQALKGAVESGKIGAVVGATGTNNGKLPGSWLADPALAGGGALTDMAVHVGDLLNSVLSGTSPEVVYAATNRLLHGDDPAIQTETGGLVNVTYRGGVVATIDCSWSQPENSPSWGGLTLELLGTKGRVSIAPFAPHVGGIAPDGREHWLAYGTGATGALVEEFLSAISEGRQPEPSGEAGLRAVELVAAAESSASARRAIRMDEFLRG